MPNPPGRVDRAKETVDALKAEGFVGAAVVTLHEDGQVHWYYQCGDTWRSVGEVLGGVSCLQHALAGFLADRSSNREADDAN